MCGTATVVCGGVGPCRCCCHRRPAGAGGVRRLLGERATFIFFVPAVVAAAAFSGWRAGLAGGVLGSLAGLACDRLAGPLEVGSLVAGASFLVIGVALSIGGEWFQRARAEAERVNAGLASREAHMRSVLETVPDAMIVIDKAA